MQRPGWAGAGDRLVGEVDVQHHLPGRSRPGAGPVGVGLVSRSRASWWRAICAEGFGAAHVQRRGRAEVGEPGGTDPERGVQVQGVGQVDLGLHPYGALEGHLAGVHVGVPAVRGGLAAAAGLVWHEPHDGLLDQPVHAAGADPVREPRDLVIHEPRRRRAQCDRGAGDPPGPPRRQVTGPDPGPRAREPVPQLEGLTQVGLAGLGGQPDRGRELGHTELRHQRRTRSGDRDRGVAEPDRVTDRLRRVQVRPGAGGAEQVGLGGVGGGPAARANASTPQRCPLRCRGWWWLPRSWLHSSRTGVRIKCGIRRHSPREPR